MGTYVVKLEICSQESKPESRAKFLLGLDEAIRARDEQIHALSEERRGLLGAWDGKLVVLIQAAAQAAVASCGYFASISHKPRGRLTTIPALGLLQVLCPRTEGKESDVGVWQAARQRPRFLKAPNPSTLTITMLSVVGAFA